MQLQNTYEISSFHAKSHTYAVRKSIKHKTTKSNKTLNNLIKSLGKTLELGLNTKLDFYP